MKTKRLSQSNKNIIWRRWAERHKDQLSEIDKKRWQIRKNDKNYREKQNKAHTIFMRNYLKDNPNQSLKQKIRQQTNNIYGKVPQGYERHHINYDSPHNFILVPIRKHKELHK